MPHTLPGQLSAVCCLLVCAFALLRGGRPEWIAAVGLALSLLAVGLFQDRLNWLDPQHRLMAIDTCLLLLFASMASSTRRIWVIPATASQSLAVLLHFELPFHPEIRGLAFMTASNGLSYLVLASLAWGTMQVANLERGGTGSST